MNTKNVYTVKEVDVDGNALNEGDKIKLGDKEFVVSYDGTTITNTHTLVVSPTLNGGNTPNNGGKNGGKPNTFDEGGMALYSVMAGFSGLIFIAVSKKKKYSK